MEIIKLPNAKYIETTANGNYKFTRNDSIGRNMPFYLSPAEYEKIKRKLAEIL